MQPTPVYVAGNATIHAGRRIGQYASGTPRFRTVCGRPSRRDNHEPSPVGAPHTAVTCKRCLAKLDKREAEREAEAPRFVATFTVTIEAVSIADVNDEQIADAIMGAADGIVTVQSGGVQPTGRQAQELERAAHNSACPCHDCHPEWWHSFPSDVR